MAITSAIMQMRRGLEADFDPDKMRPGEWAVSLDKKYVRMCFSPGVCVRMATYEAFEADMVKIQKILEECQTIEEAVKQIQLEIDAKEIAIEKYVQEAKAYSETASDEADRATLEADRAKTEADRASSIVNIGIATTEKAGLVKPDGTTIMVDEDGTIHANGSQGTIDYEELENKPQINGNELSGDKSLSELGIASATDLQKVEAKVDTIIEKAELNIKNSAKGDNLHLTDSANSKAVEFGLYGKAEQKQYSGKNLLKNTATTQTKGGITFTVNNDGSINITGTETSGANNGIMITNTLVLPKGKYIISHNYLGSYSTIWMLVRNKDTGATIFDVISSEKIVDLTEDTTIQVNIYVKAGVTINSATLYPMIRLATITDSTYEPYVGGIPSPNPDYPQEITVSGSDGSVEVVSCGKNLLKNDATSQTFRGVTFTVNEEDKSIHVSGMSTGNAYLTTNFYEYNAGKYILSNGDESMASWGDCYMEKEDTSDINQGVFELSENTKLKYIIWVKPGVTVDTTVYPMIRLASDTDDTFEPYKESTITIPTPDGLAGIPVSSGGNYVDENGQQWVCDEVVKYADGSGKRIQRIGKAVLNGTEGVYKLASNGNGIAVNNANTSIFPNIKYDSNKDVPMISNIRKWEKGSVWTVGSFGVEYNIFWFEDTGNVLFSTIDDWNNYLATTNMHVLYPLDEPIITDLTAEEIAEIEKLHTFYPITNISNDADCGMAVTYIADSKLYIDNQLAIQKAQQEEALATMLLLMPEEVQASMIENDTNNLLNESEV